MSTPTNQPKKGIEPKLTTYKVTSPGGDWAISTSLEEAMVALTGKPVQDECLGTYKVEVENKYTQRQYDAMPEYE